MTPHDSTRCGTGCITPSVCHPFFCNRVVQDQVQPAPTPALPTEGVGAVDADVFVVSERSEESARIIRQLREQVATLTFQRNLSDNLVRDYAAVVQPMRAERDALRALARATPAEGADVARFGDWDANELAVTLRDAVQYTAPAFHAALHVAANRLAAPVPSGVTGKRVYYFCAECGERLPTRWNEPFCTLHTAALAAAEQGGR